MPREKEFIYGEAGTQRLLASNFEDSIALEVDGQDEEVLILLPRSEAIRLRDWISEALRETEEDSMASTT